MSFAPALALTPLVIVILVGMFPLLLGLLAVFLAVRGPTILARALAIARRTLRSLHDEFFAGLVFNLLVGYYIERIRFLNMLSYPRRRLADVALNLSMYYNFKRTVITNLLIGYYKRLPAQFPRIADLDEDLRYLVRCYRYKNVFLRALGSLQEIREIEQRVERGEWHAEIGDPMDHIRSEAREGILMMKFLAFGDKTR